jgi:hypothetical protein
LEELAQLTDELFKTIDTRSVKYKVALDAVKHLPDSYANPKVGARCRAWLEPSAAPEILRAFIVLQTASSCSNTAAGLISTTNETATMGSAISFKTVQGLDTTVAWLAALTKPFMKKIRNSCYTREETNGHINTSLKAIKARAEQQATKAQKRSRPATAEETKLTKKDNLKAWMPGALRTTPSANPAELTKFVIGLLISTEYTKEVVPLSPAPYDTRCDLSGLEIAKGELCMVVVVFTNLSTPIILYFKSSLDARYTCSTQVIAPKTLQKRERVEFPKAEKDRNGVRVSARPEGSVSPPPASDRTAAVSMSSPPPSPVREDDDESSMVVVRPVPAYMAPKKTSPALTIGDDLILDEPAKVELDVSKKKKKPVRKPLQVEEGEDENGNLPGFIEEDGDDPTAQAGLTEARHVIRTKSWSMKRLRARSEKLVDDEAEEDDDGGDEAEEEAEEVGAHESPADVTKDATILYSPTLNLSEDCGVRFSPLAQAVAQIVSEPTFRPSNDYETECAWQALRPDNMDNAMDEWVAHINTLPAPPVKQPDGTTKPPPFLTGVNFEMRMVALVRHLVVNVAKFIENSKRTVRCVSEESVFCFRPGSATAIDTICSRPVKLDAPVNAMPWLDPKSSVSSIVASFKSSRYYSFILSLMFVRAPRFSLDDYKVLPSFNQTNAAAIMATTAPSAIAADIQATIDADADADADAPEPTPAAPPPKPAKPAAAPAPEKKRKRETSDDEDLDKGLHEEEPEKPALKRLKKKEDSDDEAPPAPKPVEKKKAPVPTPAPVEKKEVKKPAAAPPPPAPKAKPEEFQGFDD